MRGASSGPRIYQIPDTRAQPSRPASKLAALHAALVRDAITKDSRVAAVLSDKRLARGEVRQLCGADQHHPLRLEAGDVLRGHCQRGRGCACWAGIGVSSACNVQEAADGVVLESAAGCPAAGGLLSSGGAGAWWGWPPQGCEGAAGAIVELGRAGARGEAGGGVGDAVGAADDCGTRGGG